MIFQIEKMVDLSTSHIPRRTSIALGEDFKNLEAAELHNVLIYTAWGEYGWIIYCSEDAAQSVRATHPELANILDRCVEQKVAYLKLDSDGPSVDELPQFDW